MQEAGVGVLSDGQDDGVGLELLVTSGAARLAVLVEFHDLDCQVVTDVGDGAQPVHLDALALRLLTLLGVGRHLLGGAAVDDDGLLGTQSLGHPSGVHGGVAATVDGHATTDEGLLASGDVVQEADCVDHAGGIHGRDVDALGQVGTDGHEDGVEASLRLLLHEVVDGVIEDDLDAEIGETLDLGIQDLAG